MDNLPTILLVAWLLPLVSFTVIAVGYSLPQLLGIRVAYAHQKLASYIAIAAIVSGFLLSAYALFGVWLPEHPVADAAHHGEAHGDDAHQVAPEGAHPEDEPDSEPVADQGGASNEAQPGGHAFAQSTADGSVPLRLVAMQVEPSAAAEHADDRHNNPPPAYRAGDWYALGIFGDLKLTIGYYIDTLTVVMFAMVTLIASCVHIYAVGYMHDELHDYVDHEVTLSNGEHLHRRGRFHRFFQYLSLFSFSMLGICIAGNLAMVFVFWELVGICSYFLIGFYIERHSASTAANKAFIVNRVGDFGMLIGLMAIWTSLGTFSFGDVTAADGTVEPGIFSRLHPAEQNYLLVPADGMIAFEARQAIEQAVVQSLAAGEADPVAINGAIAARIAELRAEEYPWGQWLLLVAGVGIFCGCMGKSAQFPLHTWLPDAMEGPTPVSALVHSATMVAAGVFLVGRVYPIFSPEALLVIASIGLITLFVAATIALTAVDIKRVLAYSTVSQLGFMMLALGLGGWVAGLFHLITHAFFKSLLFLCSGSVIHAVHTNDMREMGGLRKKMPITAYTMLIGCLAIAGIGIPFVIGFSGFHSKDLIIEQALSFAQANGDRWYMWIFFMLPLIGALMTAFYMFRLWYMTFAGEPRDHHRYDHAHESPWVMAGPLVLLAVFAIGVGWKLPAFLPGILANLGVETLLEQARPVGTLATKVGVLLPALTVPDEHLSHAWSIKFPAGLAAITAALLGIIGATAVYLTGTVSPDRLRQSLRPLYELSWHKWWFDELYALIFERPVHWISGLASRFDRGVIDSILHAFAWIYRQLAMVVDVVGDRAVIDKSVDTMAAKTWDLGLSLRALQTGRLRQYVMFIVVGTILLFAIASVWRFAIAAG